MGQPARAAPLSRLAYVGDKMRPRCLIIGYGNPLRGDDGFGLAVAEQLQEMCLPDTASVVAYQQLMPELAEPISRADTVVFVDARVGEPVGVIECEPIRPAAPPSVMLAHHTEPAGLLALAQKLYGRIPERAFLLTVHAMQFGHSENLSPEVQKAIPEAIERIRKLLDD